MYIFGKLTISAANQKEFIAAITRACHSVIEAEPELTKQDQIAGDGDAGLTLEAGAKGILQAISSGRLKGSNVIADIRTIAEVVEEDMGGTSGALYSIYFAAVGTSLRAQASSGVRQASPEVWANAAQEALQTLYKCESLPLSADTPRQATR